MKLSVIVPCYNEEAVLDRLLEVLTAELAAITSDYEVLLVDDGSRDRTLPCCGRRAAPTLDSAISL